MSGTSHEKGHGMGGLDLGGKVYTVGIFVGSIGSLWRERALSPGAALDAALESRMRNNPEHPPTQFVVTPEEVSVLPVREDGV